MGECIASIAAEDARESDILVHARASSPGIGNGLDHTHADPNPTLFKDRLQSITLLLSPIPHMCVGEKDMKYTGKS